MNIRQKLQKARILLQEQSIKKSGLNGNDKFKFKYFELADFLPEINRIFYELELSQDFSIRNGEAALTIVNNEKLDESVSFYLPYAEARLGSASPAQCMGAASTYFRRYLLLNALEIVEHDALDKQICVDADKGKIDYDKTIDNIGNVTQLNSTYKYLIDSAKNDSWKPLLMDKSVMLNAKFNQASGIFETISVV